MNSYPSTYTYIIFEKIKQYLLLVSDPSTGSFPREIGASGVRLAMMILLVSLKDGIENFARPLPA